MIRHGESVANRDGYFSGNLDVTLTETGKVQADTAKRVVEALEEKPTHIVHSHLSRARDTASIINQNLALPMTETPLIGEHKFGDWEREPWDIIRPRFFSGENPPNGETHDEFSSRIKDGINMALALEGTPLVVCHGGVFRGFNYLYKQEMHQIKNCKLYSFTPTEHSKFPWKIETNN